MIGTEFGMWTVIGGFIVDKSGKRKWLCRCNCGNERFVDQGNLRAGKSLGCGCEGIVKLVERSTKHGYAKENAKRPEYKCFTNMHSRCYNENTTGYANYGGRGIRVCKRWHCFTNFISDMGDKPSEEYSIERVDVNGDYCPDNCVWATKKTQSRNRRDTFTINVNGETESISDISDRTGINKGTLRSRVVAGRGYDDAISPEKYSKPEIINGERRWK